MFKSERNLFIRVPDQNSRSHCTSQGLNREQCVLVAVLSRSGSVTFAKSVKLLKTASFKEGDLLK